MFRRFRNYPQIGGKGGALPFDAEVEYLVSNGQQYIDLGIVGKSTYDVNAEIGFAVNAGIFAFGSRVKAQDSAFNFLALTSSRRFDITKLQYIIDDTDVGMTKPFVFDHNAKTLSYGGNTISLSVGELTNAYNMVLFGNNTAGTITKSNGVMIGKFYITDGEKTIDLIPVRKNGKGYMYDRITGDLLGNTATGDGFPAECIGPDKGEYTARDYILPSSIFCFDAKENAGFGVHEDHRATLLDLVSGLTVDASVAVDITNSWGDDYLSTEAFAYYRFGTPQIISSIADAIRNRCITIETVFGSERSEGSKNIYDIGSSRTQSLFFGRLNQTYNTFYLSSATGVKNTLQDVDGKSANSLSVTSDGVTVKFYKNGYLTETAALPSATEYPDIIYAGLFQNATCKYHAMRIYSECLNDSQIAANYDIDRARFALS